MSADFFTNKLEEMCLDARQQGTQIPSSEIYVHASKYLDRDSILTTEDGKHIFSFGDVIKNSAMSFVFDKIKYNNIWYLDSNLYSPLHYAAIHELDHIFDHATKYCNSIGKGTLRNLALHIHPETQQSTSSLLISKHKTEILHNFMCESLSMSPFQSEFRDIYSTWLHDSISCDSKKTCLYLYRNHRDSMKRSLKRSRNETPTEHATPMDIALLCDHGHFYIDVILSSIPYGFKLHGIPITVLLTQINNISHKLSTDINYILSKSMEDTILYTMAYTYL